MGSNTLSKKRIRESTVMFKKEKQGRGEQSSVQKNAG